MDDRELLTALDGVVNGDMIQIHGDGTYINVAFNRDVMIVGDNVTMKNCVFHGNFSIRQGAVNVCIESCSYIPA